MFATWVAAGIAGLMLTPGGAEGQADYTELSRRLQQAAVEKCPKVFEDKSQWGRTVPIPPEVRFPRLRRAVVKVNGRDEFPDGPWKRSRIWLDDPAKDLRVRVLDVRKPEPGLVRVKLEGVVTFHGERQRVGWRNGVKLLDITVQADARIRAEVDCDVKITFDTSKLPPDVIAEPKVVGLRLELQGFDLNRVGNLLVGDPARELGDELRGFLQDLLRQREGEVKEYANQALARALKDGKARIPVTDLLHLKLPADAKGK